MLKLNDMDWQDIVEKYNINVHYDTLRKAQQTIFGGAFVSEFMKLNKISNETALKKAKDIVGEQFLLKKQLQKEKYEIGKFKSEFVKSISIAEEIHELMRQDNFTINIPDYCKEPITVNDSKHTMMVILSDWHIGYQIVNCKGNYYNWEIANERVNKLLEQCIKYVDLYNVNKVYVMNLGDMVEGTYMRKNQSQYCEFYQSEQIHKCSKLIFKFLVELSKHKVNVVYDAIAGNHDRMNGDKNANFDGDNVETIITENIKDYIELSESNRITVVNRSHIDKEIITEINGIKCKLEHGDLKSNGKSDKLAKEISMDNDFYDLYITGHWHNFSVQSENRGRYLITNSCLSGFNDYSKSFGCATHAGQTIIVLGENEIELIKNIDLQK